MTATPSNCPQLPDYFEGTGKLGTAPAIAIHGLEIVTNAGTIKTLALCNIWRKLCKWRGGAIRMTSIFCRNRNCIPDGQKEQTYISKKTKCFSQPPLGPTNWEPADSGNRPFNPGIRLLTRIRKK